MSLFWNNKYETEEFIYGTTPNVFFKNTIDSLNTGTILLPAEGEGRNAVYAASKGWKVTAFDASSTAKTKALELALVNNVTIDYNTCNFNSIDYPKSSFDAIALIYAHVEADKKVLYYKSLLSFLKPGGTLFFEGFSRKHYLNQQNNPTAGGPRDIDMLFTTEDLATIFKDLQIELLTEGSTKLNEGSGHVGEASIIRFIGVKK